MSAAESAPAMEYYAFLKAFHRLMRPRSYVEIGIRAGESLALADPGRPAVGIDPAHDIRIPIGYRTKLFTETSDDFFANHELKAELGGEPFGLAFIDGQHLFEFVLRDFINLERSASRESVILVHDCWPRDRASADRERRAEVWSGDVWKLIPCLKKYRPDLEVHSVDVEPTGMGVVRNLAPDSTMLSDSYAEICDEFIPMSYDLLDSGKDEQLNRLRHGPEALSRLLSVDAAEAAKALEEASARPPSSAFRHKAKKLFDTRVRDLGRFLPLVRGARRPKALGVLLCYNDSDILGDSMEALLGNDHDLIVWDHGSDDGTAEILDTYEGRLVERRFLPRSFDFYELYALMSEPLIRHWAPRYDWISWPDQDEIIEGPTREASYLEFLTEVFHSPYNWIAFDNFNYWTTREDDPEVASPTARIRRYSLWPDCPRRVRSWRASVTNVRKFNHNRLAGRKYPRHFVLRHYPMRSREQMKRRLERDRADIRRGPRNYHYEYMRQNPGRLEIDPSTLHLDDGRAELNRAVVFDWGQVYGGPTDVILP